MKKSGSVVGFFVTFVNHRFMTIGGTDEVHYETNNFYKIVARICGGKYLASLQWEVVARSWELEPEILSDHTSEGGRLEQIDLGREPDGDTEIHWHDKSFSADDAMSDFRMEMQYRDKEQVERLAEKVKRHREERMRQFHRKTQRI